ncbi:hypothetical protein FHN55_06860 [Streptomyces sp. NP160]|uniref:hypothetical protein n=1 Tax=Streptomyces sp. NP160 TaxID=2586637 RepID=UPI00111861E5|nr:hypothetical protein [Streptomyces sp. NP160]TNM68512.1 hypothetical protein FHN55_06860 [Streptomyces sp. NP160]
MTRTQQSPRSSTTAAGSAGGPAGGPAAGRPLRRTRLAGASLVIGAALLVAVGLLDPEVTGDGAAGALAAAQAAPGRWTAWGLALAATGLVLLPAVAALGGAAARSGRRAGLAVTGAVMTGAGTVGMVAVGLGELDLVALASAGLPDGAALAAAEAVESSPGVAVGFLLLLAGWYVGRPLLLWGLWRARVVPLWVPATGTAAAVGSWLASGWPNPWEAVFAVVAAAALVGCAPVLLRDRREA